MPTRKQPRTDLRQLGRRERQIMDVVHRLGRATANDVLSGLDDPPSYSAVRGMLRLLEEKGFLRHEWEGPRYVYIPTDDPETVRHSAMRHLLATFFNNSMESAVAAMLGSSKTLPSDAELKRMARLIDEARRGRETK